MNPYGTILVGIDFTAAGNRAAERAAQMARAYDSRLHIVHVIEHFPEDIPLDTVSPEDRDPEAILRERFGAKAEALARDLGWHRSQVEVATSRGSAKRKLLELATSLKTDLIVVAGAGEGALAGLGSTSSGLLHRAPCDVLVVRA